MAVVLRLEVPGGTVEQYNQVNDVLGIQGDDSAPDGLIFHVAGKTDDGILIVDVWESKEKLDTFFEKAGPALHAGDGSQHPVVTHVAAVDSDGSMFIMDIWESPEAFGAFAQAEILPAAEEGMEISPRFVPVHNVVRGAAAVSS
jgi:heme-degrading monooxygenase HmoA